MNNGETPLLQLKELNKHFKLNGGALLHAVDGINLDIYEGETIGVVELIAGQDVARNPLLFGVDKVKEFLTSLYLKVVLVLSLIAALIYGLWLLCANWNRRKPTKKIHRRY